MEFVNSALIILIIYKKKLQPSITRSKMAKNRKLKLKVGTARGLMVMTMMMIMIIII